MLNLRMLLVGLALVAGLAFSAATVKASTFDELLSAIKGNSRPNIDLTKWASAPTASQDALQQQKDLQNETDDPRVAGALARFYGVSTEGINAWHSRGFGYGEIVRGYTLARMSGKSPKEIFPMKSSGMGWDKIEQALCGSTGHFVPSVGEVVSGRAKKPKPECTKDGEGD